MKREIGQPNIRFLGFVIFILGILTALSSYRQLKTLEKQRKIIILLEGFIAKTKTGMKS